MERLPRLNTSQGFQKLANFNAQMNKQTPSQYGGSSGSQAMSKPNLLGSESQRARYFDPSMVQAANRAREVMGGLRDLYDSFTVFGQTPDSNQINELQSYIQKSIASGDVDADAFKSKSFGDPFINSINALIGRNNRNTNFGGG
tara:strand:+ start:3432 stop:3863 length:432 start_codon:yes stop_codon:yes gene_type:complete